MDGGSQFYPGIAHASSRLDCCKTSLATIIYIYIAYNIAYIAICKTSLATIISNNHFYPALDMQYPALWSSELFVLPPLFDPFDEARNQMNSKPISEQFDASNVI